ncbi:unnamed protein product [Blepharisma stoltei]|uniref:Kelch motif family protein n=1 Tax=Blepharisma stoltei TaxID=1481888 RepID=A0AAU9J878_9CILI|nr:unnamed protein product [Blepharisma stoltei]
MESSNTLKLNSEATEFVPGGNPPPSTQPVPPVEAVPSPEAQVSDSLANEHYKYDDRIFQGKYGNINVLTKTQLLCFNPAEEKWYIHSTISESKIIKPEKYCSICMIDGTTFVMTGGLCKGVAQCTATKVQISTSYEGGRIEEVTPYTRLVEGRYLHSSVVYKGTLYILGGQSSPSVFLNTVESYKENIWQIMPPMNKARSTFTAFASHNGIYVAGGFEGANLLSGGIEKFTDELNRWDLINTEIPMLAGMTLTSCDNFNTGVLLFGGSDGNEISNRIVEFNTETNAQRVREQTLVFPRARALAYKKYDKIWIFGGGVNVGEEFDKTVVKALEYGIPINTYEQLSAPFFIKN